MTYSSITNIRGSNFLSFQPSIDFLWQLTFLTSELLGSVVQVMMRDTANLVSLEFTKSGGSICLASASMYLRMATLTWVTK